MNLAPTLVRAAWEQPRQNHQVPTVEEPSIGLVSSTLSASHQEAQAMALREIVEMFGANPRKAHDLCVGEDFLVRFNCNHGSSSADSGSSTFLRIRTPRGVVL
jgi:hypothetical protein